MSIKQVIYLVSALISFETIDHPFVQVADEDKLFISHGIISFLG